MRTVRFITFALLFLGSGISSKACSCTISSWDFFGGLRIMLDNNYPPLNRLHIVKGLLTEVVEGYGVQMKVLQDYYGYDLPDTVIVWGDPGWLCRLNLSQYYIVPGDTIIAILEPLYTSGGKQTIYESDSDFSMDPCMFTSVAIRGDSVFGGHATSFTFHGFPLSSFLDSLNHVLNTLGTPTLENVIHNPTIVIYPNPSKDFVSIESESDEVKDATIIITNVSGQQIFIKDGVLLGSTPFMLNVSNWSSGTYFLTIKKSNGISTNSIFLKQ